MASISSKLLKHFGLKKGPPHPPNKDYGAQKSTSVQELLPRSPTIDRSTLSLAATPSNNACDFDTVSLTESPCHGDGALQLGTLATLPADINKGARPKETCRSTSPKDRCHTLPSDALSRQSYSTNADSTETIDKSVDKSPPEVNEGATDEVKEDDGEKITITATPPQLLDEYSDPFDLKKQIAETPELLGACASAPVNDDDYSVPYEVKKLIELKMQDVESGHEVQKATDSEGETASSFSSLVQYATESSDHRPTEEYDEPWEWSVNQNLIFQQMNVPLAKSNQIPLMTPKRTKSNSVRGKLSTDVTISTLENGVRNSEQAVSAGVLDVQVLEVENEEDDDGYTHLKEEVSKNQAIVEPKSETDVDPLTASNTVILDTRPKEVSCVGNYEEPWDLSTTQKELEEKLKAVSIGLDKNVINSGVSNTAPHVSDTRPQEGYEKPWDWKPHRKDDRPQEGYEKPWDWRPHQKDDRPPTEYDEPWDKKVKDIEIDLIHAKSAKEAALVAATEEGFSSANGILGPCLGKKVEDTRPMDEYDEPWDQKMKKMGLTRSGSDSSGHSPILSTHLCDMPSPKKNKQETGLMVGERINPYISLDEQGWYHGSISRHDAEHLLRVHKEGSYLVRLSESNKRDYSLSLKSARGFMHMKITNRDGRYILGQFSQPFDSIPLMINHYSASKLPIKGQEHMSLLHPVIHELL